MLKPSPVSVPLVPYAIASSYLTHLFWLCSFYYIRYSTNVVVAYSVPSCFPYSSPLNSHFQHVNLSFCFARPIGRLHVFYFSFRSIDHNRSQCKYFLRYLLFHTLWFMQPATLSSCRSLFSFLQCRLRRSRRHWMRLCRASSFWIIRTASSPLQLILILILPSLHLFMIFTV